MAVNKKTPEIKNVHTNVNAYKKNPNKLFNIYYFSDKEKLVKLNIYKPMKKQNLNSFGDENCGGPLFLRCLRFYILSSPKIEKSPC